MNCIHGNAKPDNNTKLRLFASSAGFCQRPQCNTPLFIDLEEKFIHFAEIAHIISASPMGPRGAGESGAALATFENLILLCPNCHVIVDKAHEEYPQSMLTAWKADHVSRISGIFGAIKYPDRRTARVAIEPFLDENRAIFRQYGPENDYSQNPESEYADIWKRKVLKKILPNNRKLLLTIDANRHHLRNNERSVVESFRQHVDDLESRHLARPKSIQGSRFPEEMNELFI